MHARDVEVCVVVKELELGRVGVIGEGRHHQRGPDVPGKGKQPKQGLSLGGCISAMWVSTSHTATANL